MTWFLFTESINHAQLYIWCPCLISKDVNQSLVWSPDSDIIEEIGPGLKYIFCLHRIFFLEVSQLLKFDIELIASPCLIYSVLVIEKHTINSQHRESAAVLMDNTPRSGFTWCVALAAIYPELHTNRSSVHESWHSHWSWVTGAFRERLFYAINQRVWSDVRDAFRLKLSTPSVNGGSHVETFCLFPNDYVAAVT